MSEAQWVYKYFFTSKFLNITCIRSDFWAIKAKVDHKFPRLWIEYKWNGEWHRIGFFK